MGFENLSGRVFGQYELRELMGVGGMGAVYRAYQSGLDREVAVKVLPRSLAAEAGYIERFIREARTAALLEHPHIVRIYDYGTQGDVSYLVMALLRGGSLAQRLSQRAEGNRARASLGEVAEMLNQIGSALDYAHHEGVLHRDIKPANIMFDNQGRAYLTDFGIAKLMGANTALTGTGVAMGSPSYMPPEQWAGQELTPATDQYALGVTVYQTIAGRLPFEADSAAQLMYKHFHEEPTPLSVSRADIPGSVMLVLNRALSKSPDQRFPNMTQFAQAFESAIEGSQGEATNFFLYKLKPDQPRATATNISADYPRTPTTPGTPPASGAYQPTPSGSGGQIPPTQFPGQGPGYTPQGGNVPPSGFQQSYPPGQTPQGTYTMPYVQQKPPTPFYRSPVAIIGGLVVLVGIIIIAFIATRPTELSAADLQRTQTADAQIALLTAQQETIVALSNRTETPEPTATPTETPTATDEPTTTDEPTATPTDEPTTAPTENIVVVPLATDAPTEAPTNTPTNTGEPTATPSETATVTNTPTATATYTDTPEPTATETLEATSTYTFTPRPTNTPTAEPTMTPAPQVASILVPGETRGGIINDTTPEVQFEYRGTAGQAITVMAAATSGNLDPVISIISPDGDVLASNDDISDTDRNAALYDVTLPADGTYTISVTRLRGVRGSSEGDFDVLLTLSEGGVSPTVITQPIGEPLEGRIDDSTPRMELAFDGSAGMTVSVALYATSGNLDSVLELYAPDGTLVADNDDVTFTAKDSVIDSAVLPADGQYRIVVQRFRAAAGNTEGDFILTITEGAPATRPGGDKILLVQLNTVETGEISMAVPQVVYRYDGTAGEGLTITMHRVDGTIDPLLRVIAPDGSIVAENDDGWSGQTPPDGYVVQDSKIDIPALPATGTYTIIASRYRDDAGDSTGTFELRVMPFSGVATGDTCDTLAIGCTAYISAAMTRPVSVRTEPRTAAPVVASVEAGTQVTLVDGPRLAAAFTWWQVRLADGTTGWIVARISFNDVLVLERD